MNLGIQVTFKYIQTQQKYIFIFSISSSGPEHMSPSIQMFMHLIELGYQQAHS